MKLLGEAFSSRSGAVTASAISSRLEIPIRITRTVLYDLISAGLVIEVESGRKDDAFVTKVPLADFIPTKILERLSRIGDSGYCSEDAAETEELLTQLWNAAETVPANAPLVAYSPEEDAADGANSSDTTSPAQKQKA